MKNFYLRFAFFTAALFCMAAISAQEEWPKTITASDGSTIKIYQPQPESFAGNVFRFRSAISVQSGGAEPVFGTFWSVASVETDKDARRINIISAKVPNLKLSAETDDNKINFLKTALETQIPNSGFSLPLDQVLSSLELRTEEKKLSKDLNNTPPKIIYTNKPSILVLIDGTPKLQHNNEWGVDAVVNSPFTIVKNTDGNYYLYGGKKWYSAPAATGPYKYNSGVPGNLLKIEMAVDSANTDPGFTSADATSENNAVSDIIVSTEPAELVQSKGEADFTSIEGTNLLYMSNSDNDVFMDTNTQQYYVLLSGRWYTSPQLKGSWQYTAANSLPADFSKIPEGSPKDNVLASVAGTDAAREAVMDAQIPQTAKVDRKTANTTVTYDGDPQFKNIDGTNLQYAVNTPGSVVKYRGTYYTVDNGVWFQSPNANGPWTVATTRPEEIDIVPPSYPVYNMKYVYIYDVSPDYVYMGYTPGYLNTFIYGPTVVYGTGYYYNPWRGSHYYARPYTWGFGMNYNPYMGWSMGLGYSYDWFNIGFGISAWNYGWGGGWWGPSVYHPPYRSYAYGYGGRRYGYYGRSAGNIFSGRVGMNNSRFTNNIYHYRNDVVTSRGRFNNSGNRSFDNNRIGNTRMNNGGVGSNRAYGQRGVDGNNGNAPLTNRTNGLRNANPAQGQQRSPNVLSDGQGNVYRRSEGQWQQRQQNQWSPASPSQRPELNRQQQMIDRGQSRSQNFESARGGARPSGGEVRSGGGGSRPSGGSSGQGRSSSGGGSRGGRGRG